MTGNDYFLVSLPLMAAVLVVTMAWIGAAAAVRRSAKVYRPAVAAGIIRDSVGAPVAATATVEPAAATSARILGELQDFYVPEVFAEKWSSFHGGDAASATRAMDATGRKLEAALRAVVGDIPVGGADLPNSPYHVDIKVIGGGLAGARATEAILGPVGSERTRKPKAPKIAATDPKTRT
jgi:hypothetical protein